MTEPKRRFTADEFTDVWEEAYEDVRDVLEEVALLLPKLERIRQGVLGIDEGEVPRRRAAGRIE